LLGAEGLERTAAACHANTSDLVARLSDIPGVSPRFNRPVFHERLMSLPAAAEVVLRALAAHNILGGLDISRDYPELGSAILTCATEKRTAGEIESFVEKLSRVIELQGGVPCQLQPKES
jgi:glycine dehydrogenase subunit 1